MKCPECGYNTFDHLQNCRKCGSDLAEFKSRFGLRGFPLTGEARLPAEPLTPTFSAEEPEGVPQQRAAAETADGGFDFLDTPEASDLGELSLEDLLAPATDAFPPELPPLRPEISSEPEYLRLEDCDSDRLEMPPLDPFEPMAFPVADGPGLEGLEGDFAWPSEPATGESGESGAAAAPSRAPVPLARRAAAGLADLVILGVVFVIFLIAGEFALGGSEPLTESLLNLVIPYFLVFFCLCFGYFTLFHFLLGQTPGKMLFGLRVTGPGGESLLFTQAFLRSTGGLLSLLPAGIGFLLIPFDRQGRGWNDRLAGTRVIRLADQPPAQAPR